MKMPIKRMCIITDRYPTQEYPINTFLDQLVCQFADFGIECIVIAPYSKILDRIKHNNYHPSYYREKCTRRDNRIRVYSPSFFSFTGKKVLGINFALIYQKQFENAVRKVIRKNKLECDVLYSHFIVPSGMTAANIGKAFHIPSFIAYGESSISVVSSNFRLSYISKLVRDINGFIAVSSKNKEELMVNGLADENKIGVFPNAIDTKAFYVKDKHKCRDKLGISDRDFVVIFVGHFINRKGANRVSEAIDKLSGIKSIFIGAGNEKPTCNNIVFAGRVPHEDVVDYLNAADVFVLPTLAEGCCNAIVEAMACGLPIVSSDLPFNDDILDSTCSIRVNPEDINEIADAIDLLHREPDYRKRLSQGALIKVQQLTIESRARSILAFMAQHYKNK